MTDVNEIFSELISRRAWYSGTYINRSQANGIKRRFEDNTLSLGRQLEILAKCGYDISIEKTI